MKGIATRQELTSNNCQIKPGSSQTSLKQTISLIITNEHKETKLETVNLLNMVTLTCTAIIKGIITRTFCVARHD